MGQAQPKELEGCGVWPSPRPLSSSSNLLAVEQALEEGQLGLESQLPPLLAAG